MEASSLTKFPPKPSAKLIECELSLNGVLRAVDMLVFYTVYPADPTDTPPQGESIEIEHAWLCNPHGQDATQITSLLDDAWTEALIDQIKE